MNNVYVDAINRPHVSPSKTFGEFDARRTCDYVDANRWDAHPDNLVRFVEHVWLNRCGRKAELAQHIDDFFSVGRRGGNPNVQIAGCAWVAVVSDRVTADQ